jgi:hypothetical protein
MSLFEFEGKSAPLMSPARFAYRLSRNIAFATMIILIALGLGMAGYRFTEHMTWLDAFLNASMILGGMGPVDTLHTIAGKAFAGAYALFCGLLIVLLSGVVLAPIFHRVLHSLHVADESDKT